MLETFEYEQYLWFLCGIPILIILMILYDNWKKKSLRLFGDSRLLTQLTYSYSKVRVRIKNIFTILVFISLIVGIANPKVGTKMEEVKREGVDLMIAIDVSNSMLAEDIKPNRLEKAKLAISRLVEKLEGDRIGLIVFAGEAYIQLPITTDYSAAQLFLSTINTSIVPTQGTEIAKAIDLSMKSFDMENTQNKAIIIITDGENHDEKAIKSAQTAQELGIFVHTLGMGLSKGAPIPTYNKNGKLTGYRQDAEENKIVSKLNETVLQDIANAGAGIYVRANNSRSGLTTLFAEINKMEKKEIGTMVITEHKDLFQYFIGFALLLLLINLILLNRRNKWTRNINLYRK